MLQREGDGREAHGGKRYLLELIVLCVAYVVVGKLGWSLATVENGSILWAPAGLALAALTRWGLRLFPAVTLGAFLIARSTGLPTLAALGVAVGNTLAALFAAYFLGTRKRIDPALERVEDIIYLIVFGALLSPVVSATSCVLSLVLFGPTRFSDASAAWITLWMGDAIGVLVVAPFLLSWSVRDRASHRRRFVVLAAVYLVLVLAIGMIVFGPGIFPGARNYPIAFLPLPIILWVTLRLGQRGATAAMLIISSFAIIGTLHGSGPFGRLNPDESVGILQSFIGISAATSLLFAAAFAERSRAIAEREEFIAVASHELKAPLAPMRLTVQSLLRTIQKGQNVALSPERLGDKLRMLDRQIDRLARLIRMLLDMSRLRSGKKLALEREEVNLAELTRDIIESHRQELEAVGCVVALSVEAEPKGCWDRLRLEQVLVNLLMNAKKYGKGRPIEVTVTSDAGCARVMIEDHGPGISREEQKRIFQRFEQLSPDSSAGLGLGLYIADQVVSAHGGRISVKSAPNEGARFEIELPII